MHQSRTLLGHRDSVYAIVFSSDGRRIASGSRDGTAIVWRTDAGEIEQQIHVGGHVIGLAFSSDGTLLAAGTPDGTVIVYAPDGKRRLCTLQTTALECLAFRPGTYELMVGGADGRIYGWEVPSSRPTHLDVMSRAVLSLALSQDGSILAAASGAGTLTFFDTESWAIIRSYTPPRSEPIFYRAVLSPDGQLCLASLHYKARQDYNEINKILDRYEILVWELEREEQPALDATLVGHLGWIGGLDYAPKRDLIASGSFDETVQIWDRHEHDIVAELREHQGAVYGVAFSPDEEQLASCSANGTVQLWPVSALLERANLPNPAPEITIEAVRHRLLEAQRPGRSPLTLAARDIVDRLIALRSRPAIERELNRLLSTLVLRNYCISTP
jgi:WD40 repeat protein